MTLRNSLIAQFAHGSFPSRLPLDARHDLPEQNPCQAAFGKLQDEVSGMPNEAATGLRPTELQVGAVRRPRSKHGESDGAGRLLTRPAAGARPRGARLRTPPTPGAR